MVVKKQWPHQMGGGAYYGVAGEFVKAVEPHTESDPVALLAQLLAAAGNVIGRKAHFRVEADKHFLKLFPILVGETSKGRKGTSIGYIKNCFRNIDPSWEDSRNAEGLSSGEGLIWAVQDEIKKQEAIREKGRVVDYQEVIDDAGVRDKRLFVVEPEFARTLRVMGRDGNILSPIIRQAWDDGNLRVMTKTSPAKATGAHISIIGHITKNELRRYLTENEMGNGFANRFIWLCVKRSKVLPEGGHLQQKDLDPIINKLKEAIEFGKAVDEIKRDAEANKLWAEIYCELSEGKLGLIGAVTSRAEAQVMRTACIFAVLDKSNLIRAKHLHAAIGFWKYCEDSARYIFGDAMGDTIADRILECLRNSPEGLSRTQLNELFSRNISAEKIDAALPLLNDQKRIALSKEETGGRPLERWKFYDGKYVKNEK
jgi:hypothetical protein